MTYGRSLDQMLDLARELTAGASVPTSPQREFASAFLTLRAIPTAEAAHTLLQAGFSAEAGILTRVVLEQGLSLAWILASDSEDRAERYLLFVSRAEEDYLLKSRPELAAKLSPDAVARGAQSRRLSKRKRWSGDTDLRQMAREVGLEHWYDDVYVPLSDLTHSAGTTLHHHLEKRHDSPIGIGLTFTDDPVRARAFDVWTAAFLALFNRQFGRIGEAELEERVRTILS
jgi:hypothetical protein